MNRFKKRLEENILIGLVIAVVVVTIAWCAKADAQPELEVGQEVELFDPWQKSPTCRGKIKTIYEGKILFGPNCLYEPKDAARGIVLKPAPRPEFKLLIHAGSCSPGNQNSIECAVYANQQAMAGELRWLRKEIEALKNDNP